MFNENCILYLFVNNFLCCSSLIPEIPETRISDWGPVFANDGGNVTNNPQKCKKSQYK